MQTLRNADAALTQEQREELRLSALTFSTYAVVGVQLPFFPLWLASRGLGSDAIGLVVGAQPIFRVLSTLFATHYADRGGRHATTLTLFALGAGLAYGLMGFAHGLVPILCGACLLAFAQAPVTTLADGVVMGAARRRRNAGRPPLHFSFVRGWGSVSILAVMLASGPVARAIPNSQLVWLLSGVSLAAALSAFFSLRGAELPPPAAHHPEAHLKLAHPWLALGVLVSAALIQSSHAMAFAFASLHWKASGHDENFVSLAWAAALVTEIGFFLGARRWLGGEARAATHLALGGFAGVARWLLMACDPGVVGIMAAQALHGLSCAAVQLGPAYLLARLCGATRLAQAQGWLAAGNAASLALATFASGSLYTHHGERGYVVMAAMAAVGGALAFLLSRFLPAHH